MAKFYFSIYTERRAKAQHEKEIKLQKEIEAQEAKEFLEKLPPKAERKSLAKAMGLKSTLVVNNTVFMTSFGKGNDAILEKSITSDSASDLNPHNPAFTVDEITDEKYTLSHGWIKGRRATEDNPMHSSDDTKSVPQDMLGLKPVLETKFYGKEFPDDNVHIQVIYSILDIEKILAVYSTNAVYAMNNLFRIDDAENSDFVGYLSTKNLYNDIVQAENSTDNDSVTRNRRNSKLMLDVLLRNRRIGYFGQAFFESNKMQRSDKEIYDILALIGNLRQWAVHGDKNNDPAWLYKLEYLDEEFRTVLDKVYSESVKKVNHNFIQTNAVNLQILQKIYPKQSFGDIVKDYYCFLVTKKHKNIGFSIKQLREKILDTTELREKKFDSVRHKLYHIIDFVIYHGYLYEDAGIAAGIVNELRASLSDSEKAKIYRHEASRLSQKLGSSFFKDLSYDVSGKNIKALEKNKNNLENIQLDETKISSGENVSYFTKLMYLLTLFLDGKEINDLLTTLINKFDNIRVFSKTMAELDIPTQFTDDYCFFDNSAAIFEELTVLNSFARMSSIDPTARKIMYKDAVEILGIPQDISPEALDEMLDTILCYDKDGNPIVNAKGDKKSGMRNFIATNVISSGRFKYLVRYCNSKKIRALANCRNAVKFVTSTIPDEQIIRYYDSCHDPKEPYESDIEMKREYLVTTICNMDFSRFKDADKLQHFHVDRPTNGSTAEGEQKQRYQAVIRLYLTIMYLLLKNMVNINSRYVMGFHALERDAVLYNIKLKGDFSRLLVTIMDIRLSNGTIMSDCDVSKAADIKQNKYLRNKKWYKLSFLNYKNSDNAVITEFRNTVAHLNAIRNINENIDEMGILDPKTGYYEMYHYLIQTHLKAKLGTSAEGKTIEYFDNLTKYHTYCRDFVKAYCVPMAYNLPRYKNLTIDGQFDKNIRI